MAEKFREILRLESVKQLTSASMIMLLKKYESAEECRELPDEELHKFGVSKTGIKNLRSHNFDDSIYLSQIDQLENRSNISCYTVFDEDYPSSLVNIYDPPPYIFVEGELSEKDSISIAVVGSRSLSHSGRYCVSRISRELAMAGFVIISGLAMGADTIAHIGALEAGKRTVAVLGSGIDIDVNVSSRGTRKRMIEQGGAVISPFLIGTQPTTYTFPARNRIISGMSLGVVVGEAKKDSGSLITANFALDQGKEVFALPNEIFREKYEGSNNLIKTGQAKLVMCVGDIIDEMPERVRNMISPSVKSVQSRTVVFDDETEELIFGRLLENSKNVDDLSEETGIDTGILMGKLFMLEMKNLITREANNVFSVSRK